MFLVHARCFADGPFGACLPCPVWQRAMAWTTTPRADAQMLPSSALGSSDSVSPALTNNLGLPFGRTATVYADGIAVIRNKIGEVHRTTPSPLTA